LTRKCSPWMRSASTSAREGHPVLSGVPCASGLTFGEAGTSACVRSYSNPVPSRRCDGFGARIAPGGCGGGCRRPRALARCHGRACPGHPRPARHEARCGGGARRIMPIPARAPGKGVDARAEPGHDGGRLSPASQGTRSKGLLSAGHGRACPGHPRLARHEARCGGGAGASPPPG
jgi:hypothetical protein